jgi:hypothetical protein
MLIPSVYAFALISGLRRSEYRYANCSRLEPVTNVRRRGVYVRNFTYGHRPSLRVSREIATSECAMIAQLMVTDAALFETLQVAR